MWLWNILYRRNTIEYTYMLREMCLKLTVCSFVFLFDFSKVLASNSASTFLIVR